MPAFQYKSPTFKIAQYSQTRVCKTFKTTHPLYMAIIDFALGIAMNIVDKNLVLYSSTKSGCLTPDVIVYTAFRFGRAPVLISRPAAKCPYRTGWNLIRALVIVRIVIPAGITIFIAREWAVHCINDALGNFNDVYGGTASYYHPIVMFSNPYLSFNAPECAVPNQYSNTSIYKVTSAVITEVAPGHFSNFVKKTEIFDGMCIVLENILFGLVIRQFQLVALFTDDINGVISTYVWNSFGPLNVYGFTIGFFLQTIISESITSIGGYALSEILSVYAVPDIEMLCIVNISMIDNTHLHGMDSPVVVEEAFLLM